jgi:hypothetical protein
MKLHSSLMQPYFTVLLCFMPDDFACEEESAEHC